MPTPNSMIISSFPYMKSLIALTKDANIIPSVKITVCIISEIRHMGYPFFMLRKRNIPSWSGDVF